MNRHFSFQFRNSWPVLALVTVLLLSTVTPIGLGAQENNEESGLKPGLFFRGAFGIGQTSAEFDDDVGLGLIRTSSGGLRRAYDISSLSNLGLQASAVLGGALNQNIALHGGLDYTSMFQDEVAPAPGVNLGKIGVTYNYLSLRLGLSYYTSSYFFISPEIRIALSGTMTYELLENCIAINSDFCEIGDDDIESDGLGFGLSLGKDWLLETGWMLGGGITYVRDSLKLSASSELPFTSQYIGVFVSMTYN